MIPAEVRLVLSACRPDRQDRMAELAALPLDWDLVAVVAEAERAAPVLWSRLRAHSIAVPAQSAARLQHIAMVQEFRVRQVERRLIDAVGRLEAAGIRVMLLKGAALATNVYPSFSARPMSDADVLVDRADAERAWHLLQSHGWVAADRPALSGFYREHQHLPRLHDERSGVPLEIHTSLVAGDRPFALDAAALWRDGRESRIGGHAVLVPSPHHQLLHLSIHFAWSHVLGKKAFQTFRDLDALLRAGLIDWETVPQTAHAARAASCCYWTFRLAGALAGVQVPRSTLAAFAPSGPRWLLHIIEKHYSTAVFPWLRINCPSAALERTMWEVGMRPRRNGLGGARPWEREDMLVDVLSGRDRAQSGALRNQVSRHQHWRRYVRALLMPSGTP